MADSVWLMVMFDLPVTKKEQMREANRYRNMLLDKGFKRVQFSVYSRYLVNATAALPVINYLKASVPAAGYVRILQISDTQWSGGWHLYGGEYQESEAPPEPLLLF